MPRADYEGAPTVEARIQAPDDYLRVNASPDAFGAQFARAGESAGGDLLHLSDFYGQVAATQATQNYLDARDKILGGDPNATTVGPDGQPVPDSGYLGLTGQAAMDAKAAALQHLDDTYRQTASTLKTPQSREMFENEARRYYAQAQMSVNDHAITQQKVWTEGVNKTQAEYGLNKAGANPNDPTSISDALDMVTKAYVRNAQIMPEKYGDADGAALKAKQDVAAAQLRGFIQKDPVAGVKFSRAAQPILGGTAEGLQLNRQVEDAAALQLQGTYGNPNNMAGFGFGPGDVGKVPVTPSGTPTPISAPPSRVPGEAWTRNAVTATAQKYGVPPNIALGIANNESGLGTNPAITKYGGAGELGVMQLSTKLRNQLGVSDADALDPAKNVDIAIKHLADLKQKLGSWPAAVKAYNGSGPAADQYARDVLAYADKHGGQAAPQAGGGDLSSTGASTDVESSYLNFVRGKATEVFPDEPGIVEHVVRGVQRDLQSNFALSSASARTGVENDIQNAAAEVDKGLSVTGKMPTDAEIKAAYWRDPERAQIAMQNRDDIVQVSSLLTGMADKTPAQIQQLHESIQPDAAHPETFAQRSRVAEHVDAAISARAKAISEDPGNYVVMTHPDVAALGAKVWGQGGTRADYGPFADAVKSHLKAIGVADEDIRILPKPIASSIVRSMEQDPEQSYGTLIKMETQLGTHWPQFFRDLVQQGGMSPDYQMVGELDASNGTLLARAYGEPGKNGGKHISDSLGQPTLTSIRKAVDSDPTLSQLENSVTNSTGSAVMRSSLHNAVQVLAYARMVYKGEDQATAQAAALKAFTSKWEFMPSGGARVPRARYDDVSYNAGATLRWANASNIAVPKDREGRPLVGGLGQPTMANYLDGLRASPTWITSPNGDALLLKDPYGQFVKQAKDGQPVSVAFKYRKVTSFPVPPPPMNHLNVENR